jgi:hypothetical protein
MEPLVVRHRVALGIFLLRLVVAVGILSRHSVPDLADLLEKGAALLLLGGLWTSAAGMVVTVIEGWSVISGSGGAFSILVAATASALALIGPGEWAIDTRVRGWRRIEIPPRA